MASAAGRHHAVGASANAATLTELRADTGEIWLEVRRLRGDESMRALFEATPTLQLLVMSVIVIADRQIARAVLRSEPRFQPVQLRKLMLDPGFNV